MPAPHVYYNEIDPSAAAWLRELIRVKALPDGEVDTRDIRDVLPSDLRGFKQCHFFAGIGGWAYALRLAGWSDDRPIWTGSCPCQPFSAAGRGAGFADERHLWPAWFHLIRECRPAVVVGEQVDKALAWLDLVHDDVEGEAYAFAAVDLPAASAGAPHIRQRLWWLAYALGERRTGEHALLRAEEGGWDAREVPEVTGSGVAGGMGVAHPQGNGRRQGRADDARRREGTGPKGTGLGPEHDRGSGVAHPNGRLPRDGALHRGGRYVQQSEDAVAGERMAEPDDPLGWPNVARGNVSDGRATGRDEGNSESGAGVETFWSPCDWLPCRDGKYRPVEPGTFPLAHGVPARVGRLRGYGNAIVPQVAAAFIHAAAEALNDSTTREALATVLPETLG